VHLLELEIKPVPEVPKWKKVQLKKKLQPRILLGAVAEAVVSSAVRTIIIVTGFSDGVKCHPGPGFL